MHPVVLVLFLLESVIFTATGYAVRYRHSPYPDIRAGYHFGCAQKSRETWDFANRTAGAICTACAAALAAVCVFLLLCNAGTALSVTCLLAGSAVCVPCAVLLPAAFVKRKFH